ncbi:MAG: helix-turn-helix domain-containing protein [Agathobacter sp.]|nr:helix-turn-helix domain-containing protein [Agathobacter sp.]
MSQKNTEKRVPDYRPQGDANKTFEILNKESGDSFFYQLHVPFQVTYEHCSGCNSDDYLNIITLSDDEPYFHQRSYESYSSAFRDKPAHYHSYFEIMIVLEGSVQQQIENQEYRYDAGSCCLLSRGIKHKEYFTETASVVFLGLSPNFVMKLFHPETPFSFKTEKDIYDSSLYHFLLDDMDNPGKKAYLDFIPTYRNVRPCPPLHDTVTELIDTLMSPIFGSTFMVNGLICRILYHLSAAENFHCTKVSLDQSSDYLLFSRITHLLEENSGQLSRKELSAKLNYSGDYINRIIHKYTGQCLHDYKMGFCMEKAEYYLANTNESIISIMNMLQFTNRTYFYKLFEEKNGMTPKEYRKKYQNNKDN